MKKYILYIVFTGLSIASSMAQEVFVSEVIRVEKEGDMVNVDFTLDYSRLMLQSTEQYVVLPRLISKDKSHNVALPTVAIMGKNRHKFMLRRSFFKDETLRYFEKVVKYDKNRYTGRTYHYTTSVPYDEWMLGGKIYLENFLVKCADCIETRGEEFLANIAGEKIVEDTTKARVPKPDLVILFPVKAEKIQQINQSAYLNFMAGKTDLLVSYSNNQRELLKIYSSIDSLRNDTDYGITHVRLVGSCSMDGKYDLNAKLSRERTEVLRKLLIQKFDFMSDKITASSVVEDWAGLSAWINENSPSYAADVLAIINSIDDEDEREAAIMTRYPVAYKELREKVYPLLRRVDYEIQYTVVPFSVEEAREKVWTTPTKLSVYELYQVALSYGVDTAEYNQIALMAAKLYPDDKVALNNGVLVTYNTGDYGLMDKLLKRLNSLYK